MPNIRMRTSRLQKGMIIKSDVYTRSGTLIVPEDTVVTKEVFDLLTRHFIDDVIIDYTPETKSTPDPALFEKKHGINPQKLEEFSKTFHVAEETLSQNLKDIALQDKDVDIQTLICMVDSVVKKADGDTNLCDMLFNMKHSSETLYSHSINVSIYAQLLARWIPLAPEEIELVSLAGLLHDIGHLKYPAEEQKNFSLHNELSKRCHEKHPAFGYKIIQQKTIDYRIKQAILTHHERIDESGFPMGVSFANINNVSRVLAIADTYATLTTDEPDQPGMTPFEALKYLEKQEFNKFDSRYLLIFIEHIAQNFIQHEVLLNNGQTGVIIMLNKIDLTRPLVQIGTQFVDLSLRKDLMIKKILN